MTPISRVVGTFELIEGGAIMAMCVTRKSVANRYKKHRGAEISELMLILIRVYEEKYWSPRNGRHQDI